MKIALAADHTGFEQLKELQEYLESIGHSCQNMGPKSLNNDDDFPDFIKPAAKAVAEGQFERGIIMGGSGQGEAITANRLKGIRCALFYGTAVAKRAVDAEGHRTFDPYEIVKLSREHNDSNMLSIGVRFVNLMEIQQAVKVWLETPFSGVERHTRRIQEIDRNL